jgi:hypothetical protein
LSWLIPFLGGVLGRVLRKLIEDDVPEVFEPGPDFPDSGWIEPVEVASADRLVLHELAGLEHAQVLRDRRPAHRDLIGKVSDRDWTTAQHLHDLPPGTVTERVENLFVSLHEP